MKKAIKGFIKLICPNKFFLWANGIAVGALLVMTAGTIYMNAVNAAMETRSGTVPECPAEENQEEFHLFFPHPEECCVFYGCLNGVAYLMQCPEGLHYCPMLNICTWPEFAECHYNPDNN